MFYIFKTGILGTVQKSKGATYIRSLHASMQVCMHIYIRTYTYIHTYIHTYIRTYTHTHTHTQTYMHTQSNVHAYIRGPFAKFVDWRQYAAVMQREAVTCSVVVVEVT
jgi:hypothetical protein